jgi:hypothetical protein
MVTQSSGPTYAACAALVLTARQVTGAPPEVARRALAEGYRGRSRLLAEHAVKLLPDGSRLLTHCWMDTYLIELVKDAVIASEGYILVDVAQIRPSEDEGWVGDFTGDPVSSRFPTFDEIVAGR